MLRSSRGTSLPDIDRGPYGTSIVESSRERLPSYVERGRDRVQLQQSWLRRQELLRKIKSEHLLQSHFSLPLRYSAGYVEPVVKPEPLATHRPSTPPVKKTGSEDLLDIMILQNAQVHQVVMQQLLLSALPKPPDQEPVAVRAIKTAPAAVPPAVVHYHYDSPPAAPPARPVSYQYTNLPPIQLAPLMLQSSQANSYSPIQQRRRTPQSPQPVRMRTPFQKKVLKLPFPGPHGLRRFRNAAFAVIFANTLRRKRHNWMRPVSRVSLNEEFLFPIRIKELLHAIHRVFLSPDQKIGHILKQVSDSRAPNLSSVLGDSESDERMKIKTFEDLAVIVENIIFELTEIMPTTGVLGTHRKSSVFKMIQSLQPYPTGYFLHMEMDLLEGSAQSGRITDADVFVLLTGIFLGRSLVATLLLKPVEFKLMTIAPEFKTQQNLKMLATIFLYLLRIIYVPPGATPAPMPSEYASQMFSDAEMMNAYKTLRKSFEYAEQLMRGWGREYIKRLKNVHIHHD